MYEQKNDYPASADEYRRTLALGDHTPVLYASFVWLLNHMNNYPEAIRWGEEGVGLHHSDEERLTGMAREDVSMLHAALAYAYLKCRRDNAAETQNAAALALDAHNQPALIDQGYIYNDRHERGKARQQWQAMTKMNLDASTLTEARHNLTIYPDNGT